eukprot:TRINITY_DN3942_c0_g1_i1.p1 TRINITY_DN3942_c0_g1~~TRINITY_DN3942_c0_g1_i1.p1  ORF type:complete len:721 (-),score=143.40 TRINITY_DN3942_c0_g1_i1:352-2514(-)
MSHPSDVAVGLRGTDAAAATASSSAVPVRQPRDPGGSSGSLVVRDVVEREAADDASQSSSVGEDVLALSLCGSFITPALSPAEITAVFEMHRVAYSEFAASPSRILANPDLRCRVDRRLVPWAIAAPYIVSMLAYGVPLDLDRLTSPCGTGTTADVSEERRVVLETEATDAAAAAKAEAAAAAPPSSGNGEPRRRFSWFGLRSSYSQPDVDRSAAERDVVPAAAESSSIPGLSSSVTSADETDRSSGERLAAASSKGSTASSPHPRDDDGLSGGADSGGGGDGVVVTGTEEPRRTTKREVTGAVAAAVKGAVSHPLHPIAAADAAATAVEVAAEGGELLPRGRLSMRPTATELSSLPLRPGANDVRFVVRSSLQGIQEVSAKLFLWHAHDKVVVSDVDGTITRSDLLGHLLPRVGRDWSHSGVAGLYTRIARNGYKLVYLTARPIGQAALHARLPRVADPSAWPPAATRPARHRPPTGWWRASRGRSFGGRPTSLRLRRCATSNASLCPTRRRVGPPMASVAGRPKTGGWVGRALSPQRRRLGTRRRPFRPRAPPPRPPPGCSRMSSRPPRRARANGCAPRRPPAAGRPPPRGALAARRCCAASPRATMGSRRSCRPSRQCPSAPPPPQRPRWPAAASTDPLPTACARRPRARCLRWLAAGHWPPPGPTCGRPPPPARRAPPSPSTPALATAPRTSCRTGRSAYRRSASLQSTRRGSSPA